MDDPYTILGVDRNATPEQINKAYRKKAKELHPDRNPNGAEDFKILQNAYDTLNNPKKKQNYDFGGWQESNVQDIFDSFFNFKRQPNNDGGHIEAEMTVEFLESLHGCKKTLFFDRRESCKSCQGTGAKDGQEFKDCVACDGKGKTFQRFHGGGFIKIESTCSSCRGTGKVISTFCDTCHARGFITNNSEIEINVPAGITEGMRVCLRGQGDKGLNGGSGNLYCSFRVKEHPVFKVSGRDLFMVMPVSYSQTVLGDNVKIKHPYGNFDLIIPPGTKNGTSFKLQALGLPDLRAGGNGNLIVKIEIDVPKSLGNEHLELIKKLAEFEKVNPSPGIASFNEIMN